MEKNLFSTFIFHLKKKGSGATLIGLLFFFLPFRVFCQQNDVVITVQGGAAVYGEFYTAPVAGEAPAVKAPPKVFVKEKNRSPALPKVAKKKSVAKPAVKSPVSPVNVRSGEEQFTFLQNFSLGKCSTPNFQDWAKALPINLLVARPLFLNEKRQASELRNATSLSFVKYSKTQGPPVQSYFPRCALWSKQE